jgi:hypothetical protein
MGIVCKQLLGSSLYVASIYHLPVDCSRSITLPCGILRVRSYSDHPEHL